MLRKDSFLCSKWFRFSSSLWWISLRSFFVGLAYLAGLEFDYFYAYVSGWGTREDSLGLLLVLDTSLSL